MRYFKVVLATFFSVIGATALCVGIMYLAGFFNPRIVNPESISFEISEYISDTDFKLKVTTPTENVTEKSVNLSLTNGEVSGDFVSDGIIKVPKTVLIGSEFDVSVVKVANAELGGELWNKGGHSVLWGASSYALTLPTNNVDIYIDVPVHSLSVGFYDINNQDEEIAPTIITPEEPEEPEGDSQLSATSDTDKRVVELAIGSTFKIKGKFLPSASKYLAKSRAEREVLFEIPAEYADYLEFQDEENTIIKILGQTANNDIKINAYCFKTTSQQSENKNKTPQEKISLMRAAGSSASSEKIYGTTVKIAEENGFKSITIANPLDLDVNRTIILYANKALNTLKPYEASLGMEIVSDVSSISIQSQVADVRLRVLEYNNGEYIDTNKVILEKEMGYDENEYGLLANVNVNSPNNSYWKIVATQNAVGGQFCIVATLVETIYSLAAPSGVQVNHELMFTQMSIKPIVLSNANWVDVGQMPLSQNLTLVDQNETTNKVYPQVDLNTKCVVDNVNATYKAIKFFAYCTDSTHNHAEGECDLSEAIDCELYSENHEVPGGTIETVYEIKDGILTCVKESTFNVFFTIIETDYKGNALFDADNKYKFVTISSSSVLSDVRAFKVYKTLKTLHSFSEVVGESNRNTNEETKAYNYYFRQQTETSPMNITIYSGEGQGVFEREYDAERINIVFYDNETNEKTNLFSIAEPIPYVHYTSEVADGWGFTFAINIGSTTAVVAKEYYAKIEYSSNDVLNHKLTVSVPSESGTENVNKDVVIRVLTGLVTSIAFNVETTENNPVVVSTDIGADTIERVFKLGEETLTVELLSAIAINDDALNQNYSFVSNNASVISIIEDSFGKPSFVINGALETELVTISAIPEDGSPARAYLFLRVEKGAKVSLQLDGEPLDGVERPFQLSMDGVQNNTLVLNDRLSAIIEGVNGVHLLTFSTDIETIGLTNYVKMEDNTITILKTLGRTASFHLFAKIDALKYNACITVTVNEGYVFETSVIASDNGLQNTVQLDGTIYYSVYGNTTKNIDALLKTEGTGNLFNNDDIKCDNGVTSSYNNESKVLSLSFPEVSSVRYCIVSYIYPEEGAFSLVRYFRFAVYPNVQLSVTDKGKTIEDPFEYTTNDILFDIDGNGVVELKRISGVGAFANAVNVVKINGVNVERNSDGAYYFPLMELLNTTECTVEIKYNEIELTKKIFVKPKIALGSLGLQGRIMYGGVEYLKVVSGDVVGVELPTDLGNSYSEGTSQKLEIVDNRLKADVGITSIVTTESLVVSNQFGTLQVPVIILPINTLENSQYFINYKTAPDSEDLFYALTEHYDTVQGGETISLDSILGNNRPGWTYSIINEDRTQNIYATCDGSNLYVNDIGKDIKIILQIKCGGAGSYAYVFEYKIMVDANQSIRLRYPYLSGDSTNNTDCEYLAFDGSATVQVDLEKTFDINIPNAIRTENVEEDKPTTYTYGGKRVMLFNGEDVNISTKVIYEISEIEVGGRKVNNSEFATYAEINPNTSKLVIKKADDVNSYIFVIVKCFTNTGVEAFYRIRVDARSTEYLVKFNNIDITNNEDFEIVLLGGLTDLGTLEFNKFSVYLSENTALVMLSPEDYGFKLTSDSPCLSFSETGDILETKDVNTTYETQLFIYAKTGEIMRRINVYVDPILDYDFKKVDFVGGETIDFKENTQLFKTIDADSDKLVEKEYKIFVDSAYVTIGNDNYFVKNDKVTIEGVGYTVQNNTITYQGQEYAVNNKIEIGNFKIQLFEGDDEKGILPYRPYVLINQIKYYVIEDCVTYDGVAYKVDDGKITIGDTSYYVTKYYTMTAQSNEGCTPSEKLSATPVFYYDVTTGNVEGFITVYVNGTEIAPENYPFRIIPEDIGLEEIGEIVSIRFVDNTFGEDQSEEFVVGRINIIPYQMINGGEPKRVDMNQYTDDWLGEYEGTYCTEDGELNTTDYIFSLAVEGDDEASKLIETIKIPYGTEGIVNVYEKNYKYDATKDLKAYYVGETIIGDYIIEPSDNCEIIIEKNEEDGTTTYKYYLKHTGDDLSKISVSVKQTNAGGDPEIVDTIEYTPTTSDSLPPFTVGLKKYKDVIKEALTETIDISKYEFYRVGSTLETKIEVSDEISFVDEEQSIELRILLAGKQVGCLILFKDEIAESPSSSPFTSEYEYYFENISINKTIEEQYKIEKWGENARVKQRIYPNDEEITWEISKESVALEVTTDTLPNVTTTGVTKDYRIAVSGESILPKEGTEDYEPFEFDFKINVGINVNIKLDRLNQPYSLANPLYNGSCPAKTNVNIDMTDLFEFQDSNQKAGFEIKCEIIEGSNAIAEGGVGPDTSGAEGGVDPDTSGIVKITTRQVVEDVEVLVKVSLQTTGTSPTTLLTTYAKFVVVPSVSVVVNYITVGGVTLSPEPVYQKEFEVPATGTGGFNLFGTSVVADVSTPPRVVITDNNNEEITNTDNETRITVEIYKDDNGHLASSLGDDGKTIKDFNSILFADKFNEGETTSEIILNIKVDDVQFAQYHIRLYKNNIYSAELNTGNRAINAEEEVYPIIEEGAEIIPVKGESSNEEILKQGRFIYRINGFRIDKPGTAFSVGTDGDIPLNANDNEVKSVNILGPGEGTAGVFKYKRVWDYQFGESNTLEKTTITFGEVGSEVREEAYVLLAESYANSHDGDYDLWKDFGLKSYSGGEFDGNISLENIAQEGCNSDKDYVSFDKIDNVANIKIVAHGADNDGVKVKFKLYPFGSSVSTIEEFYVLIMPSIKIEPSYEASEIHSIEGFENQKFEILQETSQTSITYVLYEKDRTNKLLITKRDVIASNTYTKEALAYSIVNNKGQDESGILDTSGDDAIKLNFSVPLLEDKYYILRMEDTYGYEVLMGFKILAKTTTRLVDETLSYYTGDQITWKNRDAFGENDDDDSAQSFPFKFNGYLPRVYENIIYFVVAQRDFKALSDDALSDSASTVFAGSQYLDADALNDKYELRYKKKGAEYSDNEYTNESLEENATYSFAIVEKAGYSLSYSCGDYLDEVVGKDVTSWSFKQYGNEGDSPFNEIDTLSNQELKITLNNDGSVDTLNLPISLNIRYKAIVNYPTGNCLFLPNGETIDVVAKDSTEFTMQNNNYGIVKLLDLKSGDYIEPEESPLSGIIQTGDVGVRDQQTVTFTHEEKQYSANVSYKVVPKYCDVLTHYVNGLTYLEIPYANPIKADEWKQYVSLKDYYGRIINLRMNGVLSSVEFKYAKTVGSAEIDSNSGDITIDPTFSEENLTYITIKYEYSDGENKCQTFNTEVLVKVVKRELEFFADEEISWADSDPWGTKDSGSVGKNLLFFKTDDKQAVIGNDTLYETKALVNNKQLTSATDLSEGLGSIIDDQFLDENGKLKSDYWLYYRENGKVGYAIKYPGDSSTLTSGNYDFAIVSSVGKTLSYSWDKNANDTFLSDGESYLNKNRTAFNNYGNGPNDLFNGKEYVYIEKLVVNAEGLDNSPTMKYKVKLKLRYEVKVVYPKEGSVLYLPANTAGINLAGNDSDWSDVATTDLRNYGVISFFDRLENVNKSGFDYINNCDKITTFDMSNTLQNAPLRLKFGSKYFYGNLCYQVVEACVSCSGGLSSVPIADEILVGTWGAGLVFKDWYGRNISGLAIGDMVSMGIIRLEATKTSGLGAVDFKNRTTFYIKWGLVMKAKITIKGQGNVVIKTIKVE